MRGREGWIVPQAAADPGALLQVAEGPELLQLLLRQLADVRFAGKLQAGYVGPQQALQLRALWREGRFQGPLLSGYGVHWVFVERRLPAVTPDFESVRERVQQDWETERRARFDEEYYEALLDRYEIVIEDEEPSADLAGLARGGR